jgi:hypothetical protein
VEHTEATPTFAELGLRPELLNSLIELGYEEPTPIQSGNPHATWISAVGIFVAGLFLALGYLCTGQLWLSIGLHIGWNFFEGVVFGFPVSGTTSYPLLRVQVSGPAAWTGGAFGPEAGLIVLPALLIGALLVSLYARWRLHSMPPGNSD